MINKSLITYFFCYKKNTMLMFVLASRLADPCSFKCVLQQLLDRFSEFDVIFVLNMSMGHCFKHALYEMTVEENFLGQTKVNLSTLLIGLAWFLNFD